MRPFVPAHARGPRHARVSPAPRLWRAREL